MTTKERILDEALSLFSTKGYHGTSIKDIANAVGIKDSSLYKHFRQKQEIFDNIVALMYQQVDAMSQKMGLPSEENLAASAAYFGTLSIDGLVTLSRDIFLFYLNDPFIARFRKMAVIEQYQQKEIYKVYHHFFLEESIRYLEEIFSEMMKQHYLLPIDPHILAMNFYTPIFFLLCKYDQSPDLMSEALECLEQQMQEFYRIYHT